ncbi:MAG: thioredoxin domain-containing protein [Oligoflexia bacterium]|nr:thioredoxin domain-containing protein [Oligoflexia bacterium]
MLNKRELNITIILLILGFLIAAKLLHIDYMVNYSGAQFKSFCNINEFFNCDAVAASKYAHIFGIPVALFGVLGNLFLIIFIFWSRRKNEVIKRNLKNILSIVFFFYVLGSIYLASVSFFLLSSFCVVCMFFWTVCICSFIYVCYINWAAIGSFKKGLMMVKGLITQIYQDKKSMFAIICGLILFCLFNVGISYSFFSGKCEKELVSENRCENFKVKEVEAYLGDDPSKITVYVYTDFQCPWCKRSHANVMDLAHKFEKQVKFVRRDFPLDMSCNKSVNAPIHPLACRASFYSKCAGKQGKYWQFHNEIYNNQEILSEETFINISKLLSIDLQKMEECLKSNEIAEALRREIEEGVKYKVEGTPVFRIFGEILEGAITEEFINGYLSNYPYITAEMLNRMYENKSIRNIQILDIRDEARYKEEHLLAAINIPLDKLQNRISEIDSSKTVIIYGDSEIGPDTAFNVLKNSGYKEILILSKSIYRWKNIYRNKNIIPATK